MDSFFNDYGLLSAASEQGAADPAPSKGRWMASHSLSNSDGSLPSAAVPADYGST